MTDVPADHPTEHEAHLGTGNGLVQFVCCRQANHPFDALWVAPGGKSPANVFHSPRQAYDLVVQHLTRGQHDNPTQTPILEAAVQLISKVEVSEPFPHRQDDVRAAVEYLAGHLDGVKLSVRDD